MLHFYERIDDDDDDNDDEIAKFTVIYVYTQRSTACLDIYLSVCLHAHTFSKHYDIV